jgi:hypothetical protein
MVWYYNVTGLINALPGNSSLNTVQHATIEEAVFSVDPTNAPVDWLNSDHVIRVYCMSMSVPQLYKWQNLFEAVMSYEWVIVAEAREQASIKLEEYRRVQEDLSGLHSLGVTFPPHDLSDAGSNPADVVEFLRTEKFREQVIREWL